MPGQGRVRIAIALRAACRPMGTGERRLHHSVPSWQGHASQSWLGWGGGMERRGTDREM